MTVISAQFAHLPDISEVGRLTEDDRACMQEITEVLERRNKLARFGITLLHSHFPVADDEMLVESCDRESRTLIIRPVLKDELADFDYTATSWHLGTGEPQVACVCVRFGPDHSHQSRG